jgi:GDPmannose 4,6-dehydratase
VDYLLGDASRARQALGWQPETSFEELVHSMVDRDHALAKREKMLKASGHSAAVR